VFQGCDRRREDQRTYRSLRKEGTAGIQVQGSGDDGQARVRLQAPRRAPGLSFGVEQAARVALCAHRSGAHEDDVGRPPEQREDPVVGVVAQPSGTPVHGRGAVG